MSHLFLDYHNLHIMVYLEGSHNLSSSTSLSCPTSAYIVHHACSLQVQLLVDDSCWFTLMSSNSEAH